MDSFKVRVQRQSRPGDTPYWEWFNVDYEPDMNVISVLQKVAATAKDASGKEVSPVAWDCNCLEEVCGACTMLVNGRVRQACTALVDRLLEDQNDHIRLEPMSKFPVVRDLVVDRARLFRALKKAKAWVPVDGYSNMGPGPKQTRSEQETAYPLSECMSCGCCLESCPQYTKIELSQTEGESDDQFQQREQQAFDRSFIGAHAISQVMLFNTNPTGRSMCDERLDVLTAPGGIQVCGNAQNCAALCPKEIPLTTSIGRAGRATTIHAVTKFLGK